MNEGELTKRCNDLCERLQRFRNKAETDELQKSHLQTLFESGRSLAELLASRDGWSFEPWDGVSDSGSEESQMELLVFPGLLASGKRKRHGELGNGGKKGAGTFLMSIPEGDKQATNCPTRGGGEGAPACEPNRHGARPPGHKKDGSELRRILKGARKKIGKLLSFGRD